MNNNDFKAKEILDFVADFSTRASKIKRFESNPYVDGDSLSEHHHRLQRLLVCVAPYLKEEFPEEKDLVENISAILTLHDDDEIIVGYDVITQLKNHDSRDGEEVEDFKKATSKLGGKSQNFMRSAFNSFRLKNSLASKIAKALDNLAGNQMVVEQKIGLINPDTAKFSIDYGVKVKGASRAIDLLIDAQADQIIKFREYLKSYPEEIEEIISSIHIEDPKERQRVVDKAKQLLDVDMVSHVCDTGRSLISLDKL